MLCLSGFELYYRWVPLNGTFRCLVALHRPNPPVPFLQIEKIFRTLFTVFTPSHPCTNDDTLKLFFIKMFQFFFRRIKIACIFIGRVTFERLLGIVKFILQYVLLILFSFELRFENCTACALRYT